MVLIKISTQFSEFPGLRHCTISDKSGEEFYHSILNKEFYNALINKDKVVLNIDDTDGYASSFLDEALGNLVYDFTLQKVEENMDIVSIQEPHWKEMIEEKTYLQWEERRKNSTKPIVTRMHKPWYRFDGENFKSEVWEKPQ